MVDAVGMVELACLRKATAPPYKVVLFDDIPAVSRETPVLTTVAEHVRRCASAVVEREVLAVGPDVRAVFVDQDRNVAFQADIHLGNFCDSGTELLFGFELHPRLEQVVLLELLPKLFNILCRRVTIFAPVLPAGFLVLRLQGAVDAIGLRPDIVIDPALQIPVLLKFVVAVIKNLAEDKAFPCRDVVVVDLTKFFKFELSILNFIFVFLRALNRLHIDEHRVQGERATSAVGAGFCPRVVHRQKLDDIEVAELRPASKRNQVQELADANALLAI